MCRFISHTFLLLLYEILQVFFCLDCYLDLNLYLPLIECGLNWNYNEDEDHDDQVVAVVVVEMSFDNDKEEVICLMRAVVGAKKGSMTLNELQSIRLT